MGEDDNEDEDIRAKRAIVFPEETENGRDVGSSGSGGSGSGSGGSATVVGSANGGGSELLDRALGTAEVRDWATRVDGGENRAQEAVQEPAWDLKHVGGG
jgi:hypothetical protein